MKKKEIIISLKWGFLLWLIGYLLGIVFFFLVPANLIGWFVTPLGIIIALLVLNKKIKFKNISEYIYLGLIWFVEAIILDFVFLVKLLNPADGYYKIDVYIYYLTTLFLPVLFRLVKKRIGRLI